VLTSNRDRAVVFNALDININLSDHCPLLTILKVRLSGDLASNGNNLCKNVDGITYLIGGIIHL